MEAREFDVVVFGASSVTGRRVAGHLAERSGDMPLRWAAAARDSGKLERVLADQGVEAPATIVADLETPESLRAMAARAKVVVNLVGPYTRYGEPVIQACVDAGCHYLDLTGEIPFVRRMIDRYDARAREAGVKIAQVCGYEALPPDLGVLLAADGARDRYGERLAEVDAEIELVEWPPGPLRPTDLVSGGTMQSLAEAATGPHADLVTDAGALIEDPALAQTVRTESPIRLRLRRGAGRAPVGPMLPFAYINPAVIQRTASLIAAERGESFEPFAYREGIALTGSGLRPLRSAAAGALNLAQAAMAATSRARPGIRSRAGAVFRRVFPSSGFGPAAERLEPWRWRMSIFSRTNGGHGIEVEIEGEGHPGYLATARMLGETGTMIAEPGLTPERFGCLTPATALGTDALDRFEHARLRFSIRD